jgi:hypothetical protein
MCEQQREPHMHKQKCPTWTEKEGSVFEKIPRKDSARFGLAYVASHKMTVSFVKEKTRKKVVPLLAMLVHVWLSFVVRTL